MLKEVMCVQSVLQAMSNNILMAIVVPIVTLGLAMFFATLVTVGGSTRGNVKGLRNSSFYRVISFFPYVIPAIVIGLIWSQIYDPNSGLLNGILTRLGLEQFTSFPWLGDVRTARWAVMFVIIWGLVGFYMVLFIAAIKGVPSEQLEAASLDGTNAWQSFWNVTVPGIRSSIVVVLTTISIASLKVFDIVSAMTGGRSDTTVLAFEMVRQFQLGARSGYSAALAVILFLLVLPIVVYNARQLAKQREIR